MTKLGALLALLLTTSALIAQAMPDQPKQCPVPATENSIRQVISEWKNGYNDGDPDKVAALYAADATYLTQHFITGIVHGRAAIKAYVKKGTDAKYKVDKIDLLASDCSGKFAYVITRYEAINGEQKVFGVNLVVLKKSGSKWMIVAHEAAVPDPTSAVQSLEIPTEGAAAEKRP